MGKVSEKPAESDRASNNPVPNPDAPLQLKLAFEAEISFKDTVEAVEAKLCKMQKILDWGNLMGLEEFLRPKKADGEAFTTAQELGNRSPPDPCISKKNGNFKIACKENIVALPPASSPDKAAIFLFTVYFILNLSYPYTFLQILGLVQRVFLKAKGQNMVRQVQPSFLLPFQPRAHYDAVLVLGSRRQISLLPRARRLSPCASCAGKAVSRSFRRRPCDGCRGRSPISPEKRTRALMTTLVRRHR
ncbi:hypothetical protein HPB50_023241 [Hyalomma asiaticum]|uniref:Uncharacterized protein n=1 Tax=Hyalomma asiaticum TaxID=266040 RepID=A0ACB7TPS3_HYAAI|nr:hypothetical protein HPB50_023241 [Hyalomma asiaticum]